MTPSPIPKPTLLPSPAGSPSPVPSPQIIPARVVVNVPLTANLVTTLNAAKANTLYLLTAKAIYMVSGSITLSAANVGINLNGSSLSMTPTVGAASQFAVKAANVEIYNGHILKASTFVHSYATNFSMHDLVFDNITYAVPVGSPTGTKAVQNNGVNQVYVSDNNMATFNTLSNLTVGFTGTVSIYNTADNFTLKNSTLAGSYGEYCYRSEVTSTLPQTLPNNTLIDTVTCNNSINTVGKSCIGIRKGGIGLVIQNSSVTGSATTGYMNIGEANGVNVLNVGQITLRNNQFLGTRMPQLEIDNGAVNVIVDSNLFSTWANSPNVAMASFSNVTLLNNTRQMIPTGTKPAKAFASSSANPKAVWTESGTIVK